MKTTVASPSNTDWDSVDGSVMVNRLGHSDQNLIASVWAFEHSSDIYVATQQDYGRVALHIFDPGTSAWTTRDESVEPPEDYDPTTTENLGVSISVRADGDKVVVYKDLSGVASIRRSSYTTSWGDISVATGIEGGVVATSPDSSDRISFIYTDTSVSDTITRSLSSADSLGTATDVDITSNANDYIVGSAVMSSNQIYVPYIDSSGVVGIADWTSAAAPAAPTLTVATTNLVDTSTDGPLKLGLALDGTVVHLFYIEATSDDIYHDDNDGGWGTDTSEITGTGVIGALSANKLTTDIGIIYDDAGTAKFAVYELAGAVTSIAFKPFNYNNFLVR